MNDKNSPDEDEKKKGDISDDTSSTDQDPPPTNMGPIRKARKRAVDAGYLLGQILRGAASGAVRSIFDDFLDGS